MQGCTARLVFRSWRVSLRPRQHDSDCNSLFGENQLGPAFLFFVASRTLRGRPSLSRSTGRTGCRFQPRHFLSGQVPELSWFDVEFQWSVTHTPDFLNVVPDLFEHAPDLPVASLDQGDFVPRVLGIANQLDSRWAGLHRFGAAGRGLRVQLTFAGLQRCAVWWQKNSGAQSLDVRVCRLAADLDHVGFRYMRRRV